MTDIIKYSLMEEAQSKVYEMKAAAASMQKELADADIAFEDVIFEVDDGTKFFDIFFDNIFTDCSVKELIDENIRKMQSYVDKLEQVEEELSAKAGEIDETLENYKF